MLSIYDEAMIRFLAQVRWQGQVVPVVIAGADRAKAQVKDWLRDNRGIKISKAHSETAIPYPFMAVQLTPFKTDVTLANPAVLRRFAIQREAGYGFAVRKPKAVTSAVTTNMYFSSREQARHIEFQIYNLFQMEQAWVDVDYTDPKWYTPPNEGFEFAKILGQQSLRLQLQGIVDNTQLEDSGLNDIDYRYTMTCTMFGWIPYQPYAVPLAKSITYQIAEEDSEEVIVTVTVTVSSS